MAGVLLERCLDGDKPLCLTLEDPWRNNRVGESCVPAGLYHCYRYPSRNFGFTFVLRNVPGRTGILFHWGNTQADTRGCILVGRAFGAMDDRMDIEFSLKAFNALMHFLSHVDTFNLLIEDRWGGHTVVRN